MNNVLETQGVPLTVFGGAVTEMAPEDLPEGASPFNQDCDYSPGSVFTRGGRKNQVTYANLFVERITSLATSVPGQFAPNETAWGSPSSAQLGIPGTYASVSLNLGGSGGAPALDQVASPVFDTGTGGGPTSFGPFNPVVPNEYVFTVVGTNSGVSISPSGTFVGGSGYLLYTKLTSNPQMLSASWNAGVGASICAASFRTNGGAAPSVAQSATSASFIGTPISFASPVAAGDAILVSIVWGAHTGTPIASVTDDQGNIYTPITSATGAGGNDPFFSGLWLVQNVTNGAKIITISVSGGTILGGQQATIVDISNLSAGTPNPYSQILRAQNFGFSIPLTTAIMGLQVEVFGNQTSTDPLAILTASITGTTTPSFSGQLPASDGTPLLLGTPTTNWNISGLSPATLNNPNFGIDIFASAVDGAPVTFQIYAVKIKVFLSPSPPANIDYLKTYEQTNGAVDTLVLDSNGILWDESATGNPGTLTGIFLNILPNTFAKSVTFADIEYIAFSNLLNGTDIPRQWNGTNLDRISMCGPGAPCSASAIAVGSSIINTTQNAAVAIPTSTGGTTGSFIVWSNSPSSHGTFGTPSTPGNIMTWVFPRAFTLPSYIVVGANIVISGVQSMNGFNPNNGAGSNPAYYTVTAVGQPIPGQDYYDGFSITLPQVGFYNQRFQAGSAFQATLATMTAAQQIPNLEVGDQFQLTGTGGSPPSGYDGTWNVLGTPNAGQYVITSTQLVNNVATYSFTIVSGSAPVAGQFITVANTLNGNGVFNVSAAQISAASPGTFSIVLNGPNVSAGAENGSGIVFGTIFTFDPLQIVGTKAGGTIASTGVIGVGVRKICYSFLTRSGFMTQPSPITTFSVPSGSSAIMAAGLAPGPPNVVARIIHLTGANGGNFFNIPQPVTVVAGGQTTISSSTWVNDNTTTSVKLSFSDGVLLAATAIDIPGNNLFADMELGSSRGLVTYAQRVIAWSEQNKVMNLRNVSFDGGLGVTRTIGGGTGGNSGQTTQYPLGWTVDPTFGAGVGMTSSPIFGFSFQIQNTSGSTQATYGMITQNAYLDEFLVAIIQSATTYSVRVTASCPSGSSGGNLVVDLFSPAFNQSFGSFSIPLASMTSNMAIYTGTLLTTAFGQVPTDLRIRIYATAIPNNVTVQLDRCEPFPTLQPVFSTQMRASYANNQEAFDLVTGAFGPAQNQQPINGAMVMYDLLYALKERSWYSTSDNGVTEPNKWNWKEISSKTGTIGIQSYDYGEGWGLTANREGVFFFEGGEPLKVSQEIQPLWDLINWQAGASIWLRNDPEQRRFTVGVPIPTPNPFMPEFPANPNPTSPNVVLMCNYRELNSGAAIAQTGPIRATFSGRLMSPEPARKWSFWNIRCPYSDYIDRGNNNWPQWFGTGYSDSKIFTLEASTLSDDGAAINSFWISYGFVKPEMADAKGLGLFRMQFDYLTVLAVGSGSLNTYVYPESPSNMPFALDQAPLPASSAGDLELGVNIKGQRFFVRVGTNAAGSAWRVSKMVVALSQDSWSPVRGLTSAAL
jgi:hypothetical protein